MNPIFQRFNFCCIHAWTSQTVWPTFIHIVYSDAAIKLGRDSLRAIYQPESKTLLLFLSLFHVWIGYRICLVLVFFYRMPNFCSWCLSLAEFCPSVTIDSCTETIRDGTLITMEETDVIHSNGTILEPLNPALPLKLRICSPSAKFAWKIAV